ncbi:hypothetical protein KR093_003153 [Drosophila rubida]|uniref:Uncharacterized protein n=1 Tax=Drosophila rubida TaxID=30044 RepID=A0AAD4PJ07_9MUSC|nr:hypothetical protein KR093_003153 [Drosophila rubida]
MQLNGLRLLKLLVLLLPLLLFSTALQAAVLPLDVTVGSPLDVEKFGYLELKPNGTLILSSAPNQSGSQMQNLLLLRSVLQALKFQPNGGQGKLNIKIYGDGEEHKFPPLMENVLQRIQTFFSIYRYTDTSRPVRKDEPTTTKAPPKPLVTSAESTTENLQENPQANDITATEPPLKDDDYITVGEDE